MTPKWDKIYDFGSILGSWSYPILKIGVTLFHNVRHPCGV